MIRILGPRDLAEVMRIEKVSFSMPWTEAHFEGALARKEGAGAMMGLAEGDRLTAYLCWIRILDEIHVLNLAVDSGLRRGGRGRVLLRHLLEAERQKGARMATLEVRAGNVAAIGLYKSEGFLELAMRRKYYSDTGEDALIMGIMDLENWKGRDA